MITTDPLVVPFQSPVSPQDIPKHFPDPFQGSPHPLAIRAAHELQETLDTQSWDHNFGLANDRRGQGTGKMFGVLVVKAIDQTVGYLAGFSGKLGNQHWYADFVPSVSDGLLPGGFLDAGMQNLDYYEQRIEALGTNPADAEKRAALIQARRGHSNSLNDQIYDSYHLLNSVGVSKSLRAIFKETHHANPPGGAGDCAAPRLLQYAFQQRLIPLAMAEFWWGVPTKATSWRHRQFYPPCTHKCRPILHHMLEGLVSFKH